MIFGGSIKNHMLSFFASDDEQYQNYMDNLKVIGKEFRGKVIHNNNNYYALLSLSLDYCSSY